MSVRILSLMSDEVEVFAVAMNQRNEVRLMNVHPSLTAGGGKPGEGYPCVFVKSKRAQSVTDDESWKEGGVSPTLNAFDNAGESRATVVNATNLGVRRLTPRECERLMGWPDDHTALTVNGKTIPDSARYRMCGNGVAAPVARYVAECIEAIL